MVDLRLNRLHTCIIPTWAADCIIYLSNRVPHAGVSNIEEVICNLFLLIRLLRKQQHNVITLSKLSAYRFSPILRQSFNVYETQKARLDSSRSIESKEISTTKQTGTKSTVSKGTTPLKCLMKKYGNKRQFWCQIKICLLLERFCLARDSSGCKRSRKP